MLGRVGDHHHVPAGAGDDLLPQQGGAPALDEPEPVIHLVGAVDRQVEFGKLVEGREANAKALGLPAGRLGGRHADDIEPVLHPLSEEGDEGRRRGAGAESQAHPGLHEFEGAGGGGAAQVRAAHRRALRLWAWGAGRGMGEGVVVMGRRAPSTAVARQECPLRRKPIRAVHPVEEWRSDRCGWACRPRRARRRAGLLRADHLLLLHQHEADAHLARAVVHAEHPRLAGRRLATRPYSAGGCAPAPSPLRSTRSGRSHPPIPEARTGRGDFPPSPCPPGTCGSSRSAGGDELVGCRQAGRVGSMAQTKTVGKIGRMGCPVQRKAGLSRLFRASVGRAGVRHGPGAGRKAPATPEPAPSLLRPSPCRLPCPLPPCPTAASEAPFSRRMTP